MQCCHAQAFIQHFQVGVWRKGGSDHGAGYNHWIFAHWVLLYGALSNNGYVLDNFSFWPRSQHFPSYDLPGLCHLGYWPASMSFEHPGFIQSRTLTGQPIQLWCHWGIAALRCRITKSASAVPQIIGEIIHLFELCCDQHSAFTLHIISITKPAFRVWFQSDCQLHTRCLYWWIKIILPQAWCCNKLSFSFGDQFIFFFAAAHVVWLNDLFALIGLVTGLSTSFSFA